MEFSYRIESLLSLPLVEKGPFLDQLDLPLMILKHHCQKMIAGKDCTLLFSLFLFKRQYLVISLQLAVFYFGYVLALPNSILALAIMLNYSF